MVLTREEDEHNYLGLGSVSDQLCLKLKVACVEVKALDYPFGGIVLFFSGVGRDEAAFFDIRLPNRLSAEMVAGMIYANIARVYPKMRELETPLPKSQPAAVPVAAKGGLRAVAVRLQIHVLLGLHVCDHRSESLWVGSNDFHASQWLTATRFSPCVRR